jgi:hypothetical protein
VARIAFATSAAVGGITDDDRLLADELESRGHSVEGVIWDAPDVAWDQFSSVIVRSTWDYHLRFSAFLEWLDSLERARVRILNPAPLMRWNAEKTYLRELATRGVQVVPTRWVAQHDQTPLARIIDDEQWDQFVVKPSISASAHRTWRGSMAEAPLLEPNFRATVTHGGVLVQPFLEEISDAGEWSLLFYGGKYSHSVLKRPRADDFRVQREHGGTALPADAPAHVVAGAQTALRAAEVLHGASLYARVDGCVVNGTFMLMELELIEPDLFLRAHADAPLLLANALDS